MSQDNSTIIYTLTDESPLLATASLLPSIRTFTAPVGIRIDKRDISLVGRVLARFPELAARFAPLVRTLTDNEEKIAAKFAAVQGHPVEIGGYYIADSEKTKAVMRPSPTFNRALRAARR